MYKQSTFIIAMAMACSVTAFADAPKADFSAVPDLRLSATTVASDAAVAKSVESVMVESLSPTLQSKLNGATDNIGESVMVAWEKTTFGAAELSASVGSVPASMVARAAAMAPGEAKPGTLISKDLNYQGVTSNYRLSLTKGTEANAYVLTGIYGQSTPIDVLIDQEAGTVQIPCQFLAMAGTDSVMVCCMNISSSNITYDPTTPISGTVDANGVITLGNWGVLVTKGANAGRGYNFFVNSVFTPANATVTGTNAADNATVTYEILMEQNASNSVTFYGLSGLAVEPVQSRLTSTKKVLVPNSYVYTNITYGDFFLFPIDPVTGKAVAGENLIGTDSNGDILFPGFTIASRLYTSMYVAGVLTNVKVTPSMSITWPATPVLDVEGNGTETSPYIIKTAADYQTLAQKIAEGDNYAGKYIALGGDLDLNSITSQSFVPLGDAATPFNGTFDGKGFTIKNLTVAGFSYENMGIFGCLGTNATVKNINIENVRFGCTGYYAGIVAGTSEGVIDNVHVTSSTVVAAGEMGSGIVAMLNGGKVTNCSFQGAIQGPGSIAGIVSQAGNGVVDNCHTRANLTQNGYFSSACRDAGGVVGAAVKTAVTNCSSTGMFVDQKGYAAIGGVVARLLDGCTLENSFSTAIISATGNATIGSTSGSQILCYQGGLTGYAHATGDIRNCYSSSTIIQSSTVAAKYAGGLIGYLGCSYSYGSDGSQMKDLPNFYDCYFSGQVVSASVESHKNIYGTTFILDSWTGAQPYELAFHNVYYDNQIALIAGDEWGKPTSFFTSGVPSGYDAKVWKGEAGLYPVISSLSSLQASQLSAAALNLAGTQTVDKVSKDFTLTPVTNVTWGLIGDDNNIVNTTSALAISGSNVTIKDEYANTVVVANSNDGWGRKYYRLSVVPNWFDGEGTVESPYLLKSAADFEKLNVAVGTYAQSHNGDYFEMTGDIDFASSSFQGVGTGTGYAFGGVLDGKSHTINNLNINGIIVAEDGSAIREQSKFYVGLFGSLNQNGVIKNLNIGSSSSFKGYAYVGSIAGLAAGRIENCRNYGTIASANSYSGGIAGYLTNVAGSDGNVTSNAVISACYNAGSVGSAFSMHGGIVGAANSGAVIELSQNDGNVAGVSVTTETAGTIHNNVGGIVGYLSNATIDRCVNNGSVTSGHSVAGIAGSSSNSAVTNSVNNGVVTSLVDDIRRGGIIGNYSSKTTIDNNYYDSSININGGCNNGGLTGITGLSTSELTSGTALQGLSTDDYDFEKNLYPVLKSFKNETATKALRSIVAYFADGQVRTNALKPVSLNATTAWSLATDTVFSIADNMLSVTMPEGNTVPTDTLTGVKDGYTKSFAISAIPNILKGEGSESSPFLLETADDWYKLADFMFETKYEYPASYFRMVNDLDFNGQEIRLIAVNGTKFGGVFDGNGKTVKNYTYTNNNSTSTATSWKEPHLYRGATIGLFGTIAAEGVLKNLIADGQFNAYTNIGAIAGEVYGRVENCEHKGTVYATSTGVGGIAYRLQDGGSIVNCVNSGNVTNKTTYVAGIVHTVNEGGIVENCVNTGNVTPGTTGAFGIAYTFNGCGKNLVNKGALKATGTIAGICNTLGKDATLDSCSNGVDILMGEAASTVCGLVNNTTANSAAAVGEPTSWIKNCYNTGNISGKNSVFGLANTIKNGVLLEDCYNTGDISSVTTYGAYGIAGAVTSNNKPELQPTVIRRVWNSGNIYSKPGASAAASGLFKTIAAGSIMENCYNLGNVTLDGYATASTHICVVAGLFNQLSGGTITNCWNAGDVYGMSPCNAGIAGYVAGADCTLVEGCFNLGNVTGSNLYSNKGVLTEGNTNGTAGGLFGYISTGNPVIRNCYNAGNVTGNNRVGGIAGGMFRPDAVVENCYNSGKVTCDNSWWSGTIYTNSANYSGTSYFVNSSNVYYDATVTPGTEYRNFPGSAKTTSELVELNISDAYQTGYGYPSLKAYDVDGANPLAVAAAGVSTALPLFAEGDAADNVNKEFTLISSPAVTWSYEGTGELDIVGSVATPRKSGEVTLIASAADGTMKRSFQLVINGVTTGVDDVMDAKIIKSTIFVDMQGRIVPAPIEGQPYIVKITYTDGTSVVRKVVSTK